MFLWDRSRSREHIWWVCAICVVCGPCYFRVPGVFVNGEWTFYKIDWAVVITTKFLTTVRSALCRLLVYGDDLYVWKTVAGTDFRSVDIFPGNTMWVMVSVCRAVLCLKWCSVMEALVQQQRRFTTVVSAGGMEWDIVKAFGVFKMLLNCAGDRAVGATRYSSWIWNAYFRTSEVAQYHLDKMYQNDRRNSQKTWHEWKW